jgi:hypothetical protein
MLALGDLRQQLGAFFFWFAAAFGLYLAAWWAVRRLSAAPPVTLRWSLGIILVVAALSRWLMLGSTPSLSEDVYRYRWDGRVQAAGHNPYVLAPSDPALASLRDQAFDRINFPHLRTVYPPLTQWAHRLGVAVGQWIGDGGRWTVDREIIGLKVVWLAADLAVMGSLLVLLARRGLSPLWVVAYAWHPLVILEVAGSGHNDVLGMACLWLGVALWASRARAGCAFAWAAAFLSKFVSLLMAPWWWRRREARAWGVGFVALSMGVWVAYPGAVGAFVESFSTMGATRSSSNASLCALLAWLLGSPRLATAIGLGIGAAWLWWWAKRAEDPIRYLMGGIAGAALLAPAVHPWYLVWLVPCFCFVRPRAMVAWTGTVVLAYAAWPGYVAGGPWELPTWASAAEYAPVALLGAWALHRRFRLVSSTAISSRPSRLLPTS